MNRILPIILLCMISLQTVWGGENGRVLPCFETLDMEDGLSSNSVLHILQLQDGRMVVTTDGCINLYDGKEVRQYPCMAHEVKKIPNYHGAYHVYADKENRLWVKEWGNVWCMDLETGKFVDLEDMQPMQDVFIDREREVWIVNDSVVHTLHEESYQMKTEWGELQDLDADEQHLYLFFSTGVVACYKRDSRILQYTSQPPSFVQEEEMENRPPSYEYENTSLVVRAKDGNFYQLRSGKRFIFLCFNPENLQWRTVFETSTGAFHSLCLPNDSLALIGCPTGVWSIGLRTGEMILHSTFEIEKGETLQTGINSVVCDDRGGLWLGSARGGVLKADTIYENPSYTLYIISVLFGLSLLFVMINFYRYATRQQRKERILMKRIQELVALQSFSKTSSEIEDKDAGYIQSREQEKEESHEQVSEADAEFLARAISLVEQHLHTSGYTVERLAADLCMERTGLYRKLSTLVNQSPTLFMRRIRMKRAAQMLLEGKMSIVEVAERTGFSSASYFSKLFQEAYGCKPSEYRGEAK